MGTYVPHCSQRMGNDMPYYETIYDRVADIREHLLFSDSPHAAFPTLWEKDIDYPLKIINVFLLPHSRSLTVTRTLSPGCFPIRERISLRTPII